MAPSMRNRRFWFILCFGSVTVGKKEKDKDGRFALEEAKKK